MLLLEQPRDAPAEVVEIGVGPASVVVDYRQRIRSAALQQPRSGVQPLGILELRQVEAEFRKLFRRRQSVADEGVVGHSSSTTAVVSISILAALSTRPLTSTSAIAG